MVNVLVIILAAIVLIVVGVLIVSELKRARPERASDPVDGSGRQDELDITQVGKLKLPKLSVRPEASIEETGSTALTLFEAGAENDEPTASKKFFLVWAAGESDRGEKRTRNEDAVLLMPEASVFAIADGMGGHAGGEIASKIAVDAVAEAFREGAVQGVRREGRPLRAEELVWAIEDANRKILDAAAENTGLAGMGATFVSARFFERKARAFIGHVGDSRCYRLRDGTLRLLTNDHTLGAKGVVGPLASHVRRALGVSSKLRVDLCIDKPQPGDVYVLCSDGLNKMLADKEIALVISRYRESLNSAVHELVNKANEAGGKDNISVILVGVEQVDHAA